MRSILGRCCGDDQFRMVSLGILLDEAMRVSWAMEVRGERR